MLMSFISSQATRLPCLTPFFEHFCRFNEHAFLSHFVLRATSTAAKSHEREWGAGGALYDSKIVKMPEEFEFRWFFDCLVVFFASNMFTKSESSAA